MPKRSGKSVILRLAEQVAHFLAMLGHRHDIP